MIFIEKKNKCIIIQYYPMMLLFVIRFAVHIVANFFVGRKKCKIIRTPGFAVFLFLFSLSLSCAPRHRANRGPVNLCAGKRRKPRPDRSGILARKTEYFCGKLYDKKKKKKISAKGCARVYSSLTNRDFFRGTAVHTNRYTPLYKLLMNDKRRRNIIVITALK